MLNHDVVLSRFIVLRKKIPEKSQSQRLRNIAWLHVIYDKNSYLICSSLFVYVSANFE